MLLTRQLTHNTGRHGRPCLTRESSLPKYFDSQLNFPCQPHGIELPEAPDRGPRAIEGLEVVDRSNEVSTIQYVEEVGPEVDPTTGCLKCLQVGRSLAQIQCR